MISGTVVELEGVNGEWFNLTTGDRGVFLGTGVTGLYDPPVKTVYEEPGNYPGSRYLSHRILRRDIVFGVEILNDKGANSWMSRDAEWRKAWSFDEDCKLYITTPQSGTRYLKIRLGEQMDISLFCDPNGLTLNRVGMVCISGDPFWYQDDVVYTVETQTDTRFNPEDYDYPWPWDELPKETLHIIVDPSDGKGGLNPTDQAIFAKWIAPGSKLPSAEPYVPGIPWLGAPVSPATIWVIPDYSFEDPALANRRIRMPGLIGGLRTEEVQQVTLTGNPTSFKLTFDGQPTAAIAGTASTTAVKDALVALPNIGTNDVAVTGGPQFFAAQLPYKITFKGVYSGIDVPQMTAGSLVGGTSPTVTVQTLTQGFISEGENAVIDTDPRVEQVASENGSQLWARMNGVRFRHPIPPWTPSKDFEITVSGCEAGQMVTLRLPRPWSRPWGLE